MNRVDVVRLQIVRETSVAYGAVGAPRSAAELFGSVAGEPDRETFVVACLDVKNVPTSVSVVGVGTLTSCTIHPREVYKLAVASNSASVCVMHNHPSGDPTPSAEDLEVTRRLKEAGDILGIELLDHVIVGASGRFVSMREMGRL